jgi:hypothetical protein
LAPNQRGAYLDEASGKDAGLRGLVEALLQAHRQLVGFATSNPPRWR